MGFTRFSLVFSYLFKQEIFALNIFEHVDVDWTMTMSNLLGIIRHLFIELGGSSIPNSCEFHSIGLFPSTILFQDNSANYTSAATTCGGWRRLGGLRTVRVDDAKEVLACDASSRATWSTTSTRSPTPWGVWLRERGCILDSHGNTRFTHQKVPRCKFFIGFFSTNGNNLRVAPRSRAGWG